VCCKIEEGLSVPSSAFIKAYQEWSGDGFKLTSKELKKQMEKKGFKITHTNKGNIYEKIAFVGEGQGSSEGKTGAVKDSEGSENTIHAAPEADLDHNSEGSEGSLCKVPHESENKNAATKLSQSAFTAFTTNNFNGHEASPEAHTQRGERKISAFTTKNLPSPVPSEDPPNFSTDAFWEVGRRLGYPEIPDLGLKGGYMAWGSFVTFHRIRIPDVISRLGR